MRIPITALLIALLCAPALADEGIVEIEYLLTSVGKSNCTFIRNGKEHSAVDAEDHLRMKYKRGKKWAKDGKRFIERIASKSSFSGRPYRIRCGEGEPQLTSDWLNERLSEFTESGKGL